MEKQDVSRSFWGIAVPPNEKITISPPDDYYILLTAACFGEISDNSGESSRLDGTVRTTKIEEIDPKKDFVPEEVKKSTFAILTPGKCEHVKLNHIFSPLSTVELETIGKNTIFVSGKFNPVNDGSEEEEIDEEEDVNEEELLKQIKKQYAKKPKDE